LDAALVLVGAHAVVRVLEWACVMAGVVLVMDGDEVLVLVVGAHVVLDEGLELVVGDVELVLAVLERVCDAVKAVGEEVEEKEGLRVVPRLPVP